MSKISDKLKALADWIDDLTDTDNPSAPYVDPDIPDDLRKWADKLEEKGTLSNES